MALNIKHTYTTFVTVTFFNDDDTFVRYDDVGSMDEIAENVCNMMVKHNFNYADVCSQTTGEVLITIERT